MKKILFSVFAFALVFFIFSPKEISAKVLTNQKGEVNIATTETIDDDLFIGAQNTIIDGTVNGDVFIAGQMVTVSGVINGNLHVGAGNVTLSGKVMGNVYIASGNVTVTKSFIDGSLLVGAGNVNFDKETVISKSLFVGAGSVSIDSWIRRSVYLGTKNATLGSDTRIGKDLYYATSQNGQEIKMAQGVVISGNVYKTLYQAPVSTTPNTNTFKNIRFFMSLISLFGTFIVGLLYFKFCNIQFTESANMVSKKFWENVGIGLLITIAIIPAIIIMLVTVVGIPLAGVTLLIFLLGVYFAKIITALALGKWIALKLNWEKLSFYWIFATGLVVIYILKSIPILGSFVSGVTMWVGLGALARQCFYKSKKA